MISNRNKEKKWSILSEEVTRRGGSGDELVWAMKKLHSVFSSDILSWLGSLFDFQIGGFYFSSSARNSDGYLPDIESTYQAIVMLQRSGVITSYDMIPQSIRRKIASFVCYLECQEDGFFYHPQWSKNLVDEKLSRKGRDLTAAIALSSWLDFQLPYPDAVVRLNESKCCNDKNKQGIFYSKESFKQYLSELDMKEKKAYSIHELASLGRQIDSAGLRDVATEFCDEFMNEEVGLCSEDTTIEALCLLCSVSTLYRSTLRTKMPGNKKLADIILEKYLCAGADFPVESVGHLRKIWGLIENVILNLKQYGDETEQKQANELASKLLKQAPAAVAYTADKIVVFKKPTGAFSYEENFSPTTSQGVPVVPSPNNDGDVNATTMAVGMVACIYRSLGLGGCKIPLFEPEEFEKFIFGVKDNIND